MKSYKIESNLLLNSKYHQIMKIAINLNQFLEKLDIFGRNMLLNIHKSMNNQQYLKIRNYEEL